MKNLIAMLLIVCSGTTYSQLEDFVKSYGDTTYNDKNLIETITFKDFPSSKDSGVATFLYYQSDTIKYIGYEDHEGYAQYEFNKYGHLTGARVDHYRSLRRYDFYNYEYAADGTKNAVFSYDSTKTLRQTDHYKRNNDGLVIEQKTANSEGEVIYTSTYEYDSNGDMTIRETFLSSGRLRIRTIAAKIAPDGRSLQCSYTYDSKNQLEKINYSYYTAEGEYDESSFMLFQHESGLLKKFRVAGGEFEKVKKKHLENRWIKEYYYVMDRNRNN